MSEPTLVTTKAPSAEDKNGKIKINEAQFVRAQRHILSLDDGTDRCVTKEEMEQFIMCLLADTEEIMSKEKGRYTAAVIEKDWAEGGLCHSCFQPDEEAMN